MFSLQCDVGVVTGKKIGLMWRPYVEKSSVLLGVKEKRQLGENCKITL